MVRSSLPILLLALCLAACASPPPQAAQPEPTAAGLAANAAPTPTAGATATAEATADTTLSEQGKTLVVCSAAEPSALGPLESAYVTSAIMEAIQEPLVDQRDYAFQANLVEKLPSFADGDATLATVTLREGDRFYDLDSQNVLTLTAGMAEPFTLAQAEGEPLRVQGYAGGELSTVQVTARWTLVEGLAWEDGAPVTADDSVFGWELAQAVEDEFPPGVTARARRTASYRALDRRTLEWTGIPGLADPAFVTYPWLPQPRHRYEGRELASLLHDPTLQREPLSYGPFRVDEWIPGEQLILSPNPHYVRGESPLERLVFRFVPTGEEIAAQLTSGECQLGTFETAVTMPWSAELKQQLEAGGVQILSAEGTTFEHLDFNLQPASDYAGSAATLRDGAGGLLLGNVDFRRAIAHCLDRAALAQAADPLGGTVPTAYMAASHPLYPGDAALTLYGFDPARGRELLAAIGWADTDGDGVLNNGAGARLALTLSTRTNPTRERVTALIQTQLRDHCGIEVALQPYEFEFFDESQEGVLMGRRYDLAEFAWLSGNAPPCELYLSTDIPNEANRWAGRNSNGFANAEFDAACAAARRATDPAEAARLHAEALRLWTEQLPSIPLFARVKPILVRPELSGVILDPTSPSEFWNVENFDLR